MKPAEFRRVRELVGGTLTAFAARIGVSRPTIYEYEAGNATIPETVAALVRMVRMIAAPPRAAEHPA